ncbi:MAG: hypothetical protein K2Q23_07790 [Bryobacteraceae bacterium]|nr:hypothetical protein [Bryobacteraceae bacterium]
MKFSLILSLTLALTGAAVAQNQTVANKAIDPQREVLLAKQYREKAAAQLEKAKQHEAKADKLAPRAYSPMQHKWPGLANASANRERSLAMQARRAAEEANRLALEHEKRAQAVSADN